MASKNLVNIGLGNGLLLDSTKPLPKPMLSNHQWCLVAFIWGKFHRKYSIYLSLVSVEFKITATSPTGQWVNLLSTSLLLFQRDNLSCPYKGCIVHSVNVNYFFNNLIKDLNQHLLEQGNTMQQNWKYAMRNNVIIILISMKLEKSIALFIK